MCGAVTSRMGARLQQVYKSGREKTNAFLSQHKFKAIQSYLGELRDARAKSFGQLFVLNLQYLIMYKTPPHEQPYFSPAWFFPGLYRCGFRWMLRVHRNHLFVLRRWHSKSNYYRSAYTARFAGGRASCRKPASKLAYRILCKGAAIARSAVCRLRRTQQRRATL